LHDEVPEELMEETRSRQDAIFVEFRNHVMKFREQKFKQEDHPQIFSADVVTGDRGKELGLIDEVGMCENVMREKYGEKVVIKDFSKQSKFERLGSMFQVSFDSALQSAVARQISSKVG
jgi:ClpP class serine protease